MTVIQPNSISGLSSVTAQGGDITFYRSDGGISNCNFENITGAAGTFTGNLNVGGVLTYEDVTNIDSVGVITARSGIKIGPTAGVAGTFFADGSYVTAGVVTATTFHGSGANLTNLNASNIASGTVPTARLGSGTANSSTFLAGDSTYKTVSGTTINNNANNRIVTGSGTANTLEAETTLEWDGTNTLTVVNQGSGYPDFRFNTKTVAGGGEYELFRASGGKFRIGSTSTTANSSADELLIGNGSNDRGLTIFGGTSNIYFGDSSDNDIGKLEYVHSDNSMRFTTNTGERLRIASSGQIGLGGANYGTSGQVLTSGGSGSAPTWSTVSGTTINNNADNRLITGSGTANTLEGESKLTFDSTTTQLKITRDDDSNSGLYVFHNDGSECARLVQKGTGHEGTLVLRDGGTANIILDGETGSISYINGGGGLAIGTNALVSGRPDNVLHLHKSSGGTADGPTIWFTNSNTGVSGSDGFTVGLNDTQSPYLWNRENTDLRFGTNNNHRMTLDNDGNLRLLATNNQFSTAHYQCTPTISSNYTVTTTYNEMMIGPITINNGVTLAVNTGARLVVL